MFNKRYCNLANGSKSLAKGTAAAALIALLLSGCTTKFVDRYSGEEENVSTEEVAEESNKLIGEIVTVRSEVINKVSNSAFTIGDQDLFNTEEVLVLNGTGKTFTLPTDKDIEIQVTGEVQKVVISEIRRDFNLELDPKTYQEYKNKPAIIAQSFAIAPKPGDITAEPSRFYNQPLAVRGEVDETLSQVAFTLDEDQLFNGSDLLVVNMKPQQTFNEGDEVVVTGRLRPVTVSELDKNYILTEDKGVQTRIEELKRQEKPVLMADFVYPSGD